MTVAETAEIFDYWCENPPAHLLLQTIARMLGWKPAVETSMTLSQIAALAPPGLAVAQDGDIGMPPPVFDVAHLRDRNRARLAKRPDR